MKEVVDFFHEIGVLKNVKRSGWWVANIKNPESVAEHSFRAAVVGYFLAKMEGADEKKTALMCLFHDFPEARINDLHKICRRYINLKEAEEKVIKEQLEALPEDIKKDIHNSLDEFHDQKTREGIIARDADLIENALQAKEYADVGYKDCQNWINNIRKILKTESAKKLLKHIEKTDSSSWWRSLKRIER